jgi:hypothetical protein
MRNAIVNEIKNGRLKGKVDLYGRGFNEIPDKLTGLKDYMFSIVVENTKKDYYFTEKLIDCFRTGTIPIYWGCPSIGEFFDLNGMIIFDDIYEMKPILNSINLNTYNEKIESVRNNFEKAKKYLIAEDYMFENYLSKYYENV